MRVKLHIFLYCLVFKFGTNSEKNEFTFLRLYPFNYDWVVWLY